MKILLIEAIAEERPARVCEHPLVFHETDFADGTASEADRRTALAPQLQDDAAAEDRLAQAVDELTRTGLAAQEEPEALDVELLELRIADRTKGKRQRRGSLFSGCVHGPGRVNPHGANLDRPERHRIAGAEL